MMRTLLGALAMMAFELSPVSGADVTLLDLSTATDRIQVIALSSAALAVGTRSGEIRVYSIDKNPASDEKSTWSCGADISAMAWKNEKTVIVGTITGKIYEISVQTPNQVHPLVSITSRIRCVYHDNEYLVVGDTKGEVSIFQDGQLPPITLRFPGPAGFIGIVGGADSQSFIIGNEPGIIALVGYDGIIKKSINVGFPIAGILKSINGDVYVSGEQNGRIDVFTTKLDRLYTFQSDELGSPNFLSLPSNGQGVNALFIPTANLVGGRLKRIETRVLCHLDFSNEKNSVSACVDLTPYKAFYAVRASRGIYIVEQRRVLFSVR